MTEKKPGYWARQHNRLLALRELYREHGVLVLSPTVLGLRERKDELESEVIELRSKTIEAVQRLDVKDAEYREAKIDAILFPHKLDRDEK